MSSRLQQSLRESEQPSQRNRSILDSKIFSEFSVFDDQSDALGVGMLDSTERLNLGTQVGRNISRVRWIGHSDTYIPDPLATEYFFVDTYADCNNDVSLWRLSATEAGYESNFKTTRLHKATVNSSITGIAVSLILFVMNC